MPASQRSHPEKQLPCPVRPVLVDESTGEPIPTTTPADPHGLGRRRGVWSAAPKKRRPWTHRCMRYVRFRGFRGLYESRFPMGRQSPLGDVTLGIHRSESAAHRAAVEFRRRGPSDERYPQILEELIRLGFVPPRVLPKWVCRLAGGGYGARRKTRAGLVVLAGPYETPAAAYAAMLAAVSPARAAA
jgi:hypothetical protein